MLDNDIALTTWMTDGLRVLDLSNPSTPTQLAAFMPPAVADPSGTAGAGPNNASGGGSLQRGISWPTQRLITGVDMRKLSATSARIVVSDINGGLSVLDATITRPALAPPPPSPEAPPPPPPPVGGPSADTSKPSLSAFSLRPAAFRARPSGSSITRVGGTLVRYRLSEAATTTFTVQRIEKGRRKGRACQKPARSNRSGAPCTRYVTIRGSFKHSGVSAKLNSVRFSGRIGGRKLAPARYRMRALARDAAANTSAVRTANFRIIR